MMADLVPSGGSLCGVVARLVVPDTTPEQEIRARRQVALAWPRGLVDRDDIVPLLFALGVHPESEPPRGRHTKSPGEKTGARPG